MNTSLIIITLVLLGILMILVEFLITPGMGFAGIIGLASFIGACVFAFVREGTTTGTIVTAVVVLIVAVLFIFMLRSKTWKRLEQKEEIDTRVNRESEKVRVGEHGVTISRLAPSGNVRFTHTSCEAKSYGGLLIDQQTEVEVISIEDNEITVKPVTDTKQ